MPRDTLTTQKSSIEDRADTLAGMSFSDWKEIYIANCWGEYDATIR